MIIIQYDSRDAIIIVIVEMIPTLKVKIRNMKDDSTRRIRNDANGNTKKSVFIQMLSKVTQ
jgi:hypothetical protein